MQSPFAIEIEYELYRSRPSLQIGIRVNTADGIAVFTTDDTDRKNGANIDRSPGIYSAQCKVPGGLLSAQIYKVSFGAHIPNLLEHYFVEGAIEFRIAKLLATEADIDHNRKGVINPLLPWSINKIQ